MSSNQTEITRRTFMQRASVCAMGVACTQMVGGNALADLAPATSEAPKPAAAKKAEKITSIIADPAYWKAVENQEVVCTLCPSGCRLAPDVTSRCNTRQNRDGKLYTNAYNNPTILSMDPFTKLPLYHVMPGSKALILAPGGCNLRCSYCQNWAQSQSEPGKLKPLFYVTKEDAVQGAVSKKCAAVGYTYTDPSAYFEYARDVAMHAKEKGMKSVFGTSAYLNPSAVKELCSCASAFSVTLKGFNETFYTDVPGVRLQPVLDSLVEIRKSGVWLEVVNLVIPTLNDDMKEMRAMCKWIKTNLGADTPLHFEQFRPAFRLNNLPQTPVHTLEEARSIAFEEGLKFVYICNVSPHESNHTYCPSCKTMVIQRLGFETLESKLNNGACPKCATKLPGIWS